MFESKLNTISYDTQKIASDSNYSIFLSASAGTGKTKVLTDRFLRLLLSGTPPKNILCITFTNAAAKEMLERIRSKLLLWSELEEAALKSELEKILEGEIDPAQINNARSLLSKFNEDYQEVKIKTLHSFSFDILKRYQLEFGTFNNFELIDETVKTQFINDMLANTFKDEVAAYKLLLEHIELSRLKEIIINVISNNRNFANFIAKLDGDIQFHIEARENCEHLKSKEILEQLIQVLPTENLNKALDNAQIAFINDFCSKDKSSRLNILKDYLTIFLKENGERRVRLFNKEFKEEHPEIYTWILNEQERVCELFESYKKALNAELTIALCTLLKHALNQYITFKTESKLIDYDDILNKTLELLKHSENAFWVLYQLDMAIDHILIDEAQDLSPTQWEIINLIADEFFAGIGARDINRTVFIVGDFKQSIYSFQGANPYYFESQRELIKSKCMNSNKAFLDLDMQLSYRSSKKVLEIINKLYHKDQFLDWLGVNIDSLNHEAFKDSVGNVELMPLELRDEIDIDEGWETPTEEIPNDQRRKLAKRIAEKISIWLKQEKQLEYLKRPIRANDIMILVRKRSDFLECIKSELLMLNIPVSDASIYDFHSNLIVQDLLAFLKFLVLPNDDYSLACILKSPIFGFSEEQLFKACFNRHESLFENLKHNFLKTYEILKNFLRVAEEQKISQIVFNLLYKHSKLQNYESQYGLVAKNYIETFLTAVFKYESLFQELATIDGFIEWIKLYEPARLNDDKTNDAVRVSTIHGAKGLQAPIVILADAASSEYVPHSEVFFCKDGEFYFSHNASLDPKKIKEIKLEKKKLGDEESCRLFYVALTRAEEELYIAGCENMRVKDSWYGMIESVIYS